MKKKWIVGISLLVIGLSVNEVRSYQRNSQAARLAKHIKNGNFDTIRNILIKNPPLVDAQFPEGIASSTPTPLALAVASGHKQIIQLLVDCGAGPYDASSAAKTLQKKTGRSVAKEISDKNTFQTRGRQSLQDIPKGDKEELEALGVALAVSAREFDLEQVRLQIIAAAEVIAKKSRRKNTEKSV